MHWPTAHRVAGGQRSAGRRSAVGGRRSASQRRIQGVAVEAGQHSAHRALGGQVPLRHHRIGTQAERLQHVGGHIRDPLADRQQRGRAGQDRARGKRQHHGQPVAHPARVPRVRHFGQAFQQSPDLPGHGRWLVAELVNSGLDQKGCVRRHGLPMGSRDVENSMITDAVTASSPQPSRA